MGSFSLVLKEIWQRRWRFLIGLVGIALPIIVFVASTILMVYSQDEVRKMMKNFGLNIFILPRELELGDYYTAEFGDATMSEDYVEKLFRSGIISARHFTGMLQARVELSGHKGILTGVLPEKDRITKPKPEDILGPDETRLGSIIANRLGAKPGDTLTVMGQTLRVREALPEKGTVDDIRIRVHLHTAQKMLGKGGEINSIEALSCVCFGKSADDAARDIEKRLPGIQAIPIKEIAKVRRATREHIKLIAAVLISLTLIIGGVAVAMQAFANVAERRREIGMFLAIGASPYRIAWLFLQKFILLGILGGLIGYLLGSFLALALGPGLFTVWRPFKAAFGLVGPWLALSAVGIALGISLVFSSISVFKAAWLDPATILRGE